MPRSIRKESPTSLYHVVQRGVGQQILFEDDEDKEFYLELLVRFSPNVNEGDQTNWLLAWCLMSNHSHLLVQMPLGALSDFMKTIGTTYARYFNDRHGRTGHLFQDRFKSESIETDEHLLMVVRYIHYNPQKAGISSFESFTWSSYQEYTGGSKFNLVNTAFVLGIIGGLRNYEDFHRSAGAQEDQTGCLDIDDVPSKKTFSDKEVIAIVESFLGKDGIYKLNTKERDERNRVLLSLKEAGISIRQLARVTGIGKNIIERA